MQSTERKPSPDRRRRPHPVRSSPITCRASHRRARRRGSRRSSARSMSTRRGSRPCATRWRRSSSARPALVDRLLVALLAGGHVLLEGVPGLAKTLSLKTLSGAIARDLPADPVHARHAAGRHRRHARLQPAAGDLRNEEGARLRELHPRRRDQPRARQGAERAARGDAGAPGHAGRTRPIRCRRRSWSWPRRTPSSRRAPTRCRRRRSIAFFSRSTSATRAPTKSCGSWRPCRPARRGWRSGRWSRWTRSRRRAG